MQDERYKIKFGENKAHHRDETITQVLSAPSEVISFGAGVRSKLNIISPCPLLLTAPRLPALPYSISHISYRPKE